MKSNQEPQPSANKRRSLKIAAVAVAVVAIGVVYAVLRDPLFSDAYSAREIPEYDAWLKENIGGGSRSLSYSAEEFRSCQLTNVRGELHFILPYRRHMRIVSEVESLERVSHGGTGQAGRGRLEIRYLTLAYDTEFQGPSGSMVTPDFYGVDGERIPEGDLDEILGGEPPRFVNDHVHSPVFCVGVKASNVGAFKIRNARIFDARTKWPQTWFGWGTGRISSTLIEVEQRLSRFHGGPVEVFLDVVFGEAEVVKLPPRRVVTPEAVAAGGAVLGAVDGARWGAYGILFEEGRRLAHLPKEEGTTTFVVFADQDADFGIELNDGEELAVDTPFRWGNVHILQVEAPLKDIQHVLVKPYSHAKRFVFELNSLPGQPHVDDSVRNLADRVIPYAQFRHPREMLMLMASRMDARLEDPSPPLAVVPGFQPITLTNTTPRELAELFVNSVTNYNSVRFDRRESRLILKRPLKDVLREKIDKLMN
jgi:hypothetical protein